ncbi:MAG TPA: deaminase [Bryobacteraceae bacterium]|jgi:dCMP deaminase|nr:deaminase [Bryobacteraceae bacterium]
MTANPIEESRWLALCASKGCESPDPRTKVGCVIVSSGGNVLCEACNTYPDGVLDGIEGRTEAPLKYIWIEHAERNAIYLAARRGIATEGCTLVVELIPCVECARALIQAGIARVVINRDRSAEYDSARYSFEHPTALAMMAEAGVLVRFASLTFARDTSVERDI